jgi:putative ABC transport system ATP-binding protein
MDPLMVENVAKRFRQGSRDVLALDGVSLNVTAGAFVAVMGASGSGKSTLLHLVAGLAEPDAGRIFVNGTDLVQLTDRERTLFRRRQIGLIFQAFNLIPTLSAEENIALPLMLEGINGRQASDKVESLLQVMGMTDRRGHRPDALSGGEQQRVAIGRALVTEPALILADEPTGNLDATNRKWVCELLRKLSREQGRTIVMVTHEPHVAAYASEVAILRYGKLVERFANTGAETDSSELASKYQLAAG